MDMENQNKWMPEIDREYQENEATRTKRLRNLMKLNPVENPLQVLFVKSEKTNQFEEEKNSEDTLENVCSWFVCVRLWIFKNGLIFL